MRESVYFPFFKSPDERHVSRCPQTLVERVNIGFRASESYFWDAASSSIGSLVGRSQRLILIPLHACPYSIPTSRSRELHPQPDVQLADSELRRENRSPRAKSKRPEMSEMVVRGRGESGACVGVVHFERESTRARKGSRSHSNQSMYVPDVREVGDRCRDFVMPLTPHPITCVRKCRAAILNLEHVRLVVLCTLTSTRMRHPTNLDVENQNSQ